MCGAFSDKWIDVVRIGSGCASSRMGKHIDPVQLDEKLATNDMIWLP